MDVTDVKKHPRRRTRRGKKRKRPAVPAPMPSPLVLPVPLATIRARLHTLSQRRASHVS